MITDAELLKLVMDRFPEADTDGIVEQFSLLKVGLLQANAKLAVGEAAAWRIRERRGPSFLYRTASPVSMRKGLRWERR